MPLSRTHRFTAALLAAMLLFGGATPLVQHLCAQMGLGIVHACCHEGGNEESEHHHGEHLPLSEHEHERVDVGSLATVCCSDDIQEFETPPAVLPKQDIVAPALAAVGTAAVALDNPETSYTYPDQSRAPPLGPDVPLFLLHEAFLN